MLMPPKAKLLDITNSASITRDALGKQAECVADHQSHDRVVAVCRIKGVSVGDSIRAAAIIEGGNGR